VFEHKREKVAGYWRNLHKPVAIGKCKQDYDDFLKAGYFFSEVVLH
jgi:hypothetical protein